MYLCLLLECFINNSNSIIISRFKSIGYWKCYEVALWWIKRKTLHSIHIGFLYSNTLDTCINSVSEANMLKEEELLEYQILWNIAMAFVINFIAYHASTRYALCCGTRNMQLILLVFSWLLHVPHSGPGAFLPPCILCILVS